jgi:ATP citrate (pro-S)-lyase
MSILESIRKSGTGILVLGNHPGIIQSILDFDVLSGKREPSVLACVTAGRKTQKFFWGKREVLIPCFRTMDTLPEALRRRVRWMLNVQSGRRTFESTRAFFETFPNALGGHLFAENVPEAHATELIRMYGGRYFLAGPSGVGLLVPGHLKLGAIGGVDPAQLLASNLATEGSVAVVSTSGGMTNELIRAVTQAGKRLSFACAIGGDRFPVASLTDVLMLAEHDRNTSAILYFGELGGVDEYEIVEMRKKKKLTKPVLAYIAGAIDEAFDEHMQFGHAKALVARPDESARAKRRALRSAGVVAPDTFPEFLSALRKLTVPPFRDTVIDTAIFMDRKKSILSTRPVLDMDAIPVFIRNKKLVAEGSGAFSREALEALLGRPPRSAVTTAFADAVFRLLIDHGGHVSGAVNTMITARAGKDMVSSLASGLLTIGPRFGGAVNSAANCWLRGVSSGLSASEFAEKETRSGTPIPGIGHRKYRLGLPDPRVSALAEFATLLKKHSHFDFARAVEAFTTTKNGTLILNVDGAIASLFLDILREYEEYTDDELRELVEAEFFNALFIIPRTVGFLAHFLEQKKNDEGLFRLPDELLFVREKSSSSTKKGRRK